MAKLRSPILGYNHNIRYRGLVFHVQSEDSGLSNPHVFTHLFHGGVILTTRKLVYDASASEETVKSLMQSQHKAVLRDLKRGSFDDKMDAYLGGTPGLLPRGQGVDGELAVAPALDSAAPLALEPAEVGAQVAPAPAPAVSRTPTPPPGAVAIPPPARISGRMAAISSQDTLEARAPTERFAPDVHGALPTSLGAGAPKVRDVSAAFQAMLVEEGGSGGLAEIPGEDGLVEIRLESSDGAGVPPDQAASMRPGSYAQHRRRESSGPENLPAAPVSVPPSRQTQPSAGATAPAPAAPRPGAVAPRAAGGMPAVRPPSPMARASSQVGIPRATPAGGTPRPGAVTPPGYASTSRTPTGTPARSSAQSRTRTPSGGGGVVVTRPAVIIGAPARQVGAPAAAAPPAAPKPPSARVRKAREESDGGMFGQDLISEKSLDEVILAYLSEDSSDD